MFCCGTTQGEECERHIRVEKNARSCCFLIQSDKMIAVSIANRFESWEMSN